MSKPLLTTERLNVGIGSLTLMSVGLLGYSVLRSTKPSKKKKNKKKNKKNDNNNTPQGNDLDINEIKKIKYSVLLDNNFDISFVMSSFDGFDAYISSEKKNKEYKLKIGSKLIKINNESLNDLTFQEICEKLKKAKKNAKKDDKQIKLTFLENNDLEKDWTKASLLKDEANKLYKEGKVSEAIAKVSNAIELHSTNKVFYSNRVLMYLKLSKYDNALNDCYKIRELDPNNVYSKGQHLRGLVLQNKKRYIEAIDAFQNTLKLNKDHTPAKTRLNECMKHYYYIKFIETFIDNQSDKDKIVPIVLDYIS